MCKPGTMFEFLHPHRIMTSKESYAMVHRGVIGVAMVLMWFVCRIDGWGHRP